MFLGDSGTMLLSFILSYFFIKSANVSGILYSDEIFLIMMIPGFELLRLAITRILKKKHPFKPDNNHIHHYMMDRFSFLKSFIIIQLLLIMPYIIYLFFSSSIASLIISFTTYSLVLVFIKKN
jgi:UDP-GlcNAc:undecaprenyl-phosphate GlcNAc-1-phosphate transferase